MRLSTYVPSEVSHGQAVGDCNGDAPAFLCKEDFRAAKDRACELVLAICEPGFAAVVVAGQGAHPLVEIMCAETLSLTQYNLLGLRNSSSEAADPFIKGAPGWSWARGQADALVQLGVECLVSFCSGPAFFVMDWPP